MNTCVDRALNCTTYEHRYWTDVLSANCRSNSWLVRNVWFNNSLDEVNKRKPNRNFKYYMVMKILLLKFLFKLKEGRRIIGNKVPLVKERRRLFIRKYSFSQRTLNEWNKSTDV